MQVSFNTLGISVFILAVELAVLGYANYEDQKKELYTSRKATEGGGGAHFK